MLYPQGTHHTSFHSPLTSRCFPTESGPCGQRHPVSRDTDTLGADPALGGWHRGATAPLRGIRKHAGTEHEEDLPQPLHHRHTAHRWALYLGAPAETWGRHSKAVELLYWGSIFKHVFKALCAYPCSLDNCQRFKREMSGINVNHSANQALFHSSNIHELCRGLQLIILIIIFIPIISQLIKPWVY